MRWDFRNNPIAVCVMVLIISWNIALAVHMSGDLFFIDTINLGSMGLYVLAALQVILVLLAYASLKRTQTTLTA